MQARSASLGLLLLIAASCAGPPAPPAGSPAPAKGAAPPTRAERARPADDEFLGLKAEGQFQDALRLAQERLTQTEQELGPDHLQTAVWLNQLGLIYAHLGDYERAEAAYRRSLEIKQGARKPSQLAVAVGLFNLGELYVTTGDYDRAEPLLMRSRELRERALGPDRPEVASCLAALGRLKMFTGDYRAAEAFTQRALTINERALGPDHWRVAACLDILAQVRRHQGDFPEAETVSRRAMALLDAAPRANPYLRARNLNNLAGICAFMGRYAQAEAYYQQALDVYEASVGTRHPAAAQCLSELAGLYGTLGNARRSEQLQRQALETLEATYGRNHLRVAWALEKMGALHAATGDAAASARYYREALEIVEKTVGPDHPEAAACLSGMGAALFSMNRYAQAGECYDRALAIREKALGSDKVQVAHTLLSQGRLAQATGDPRRAQVLYTRALAIYEAAFGRDHPKVAACYDRLTVLHGALGDFPTALDFARKAQAANRTTIERAMDIPSDEVKVRYLATQEQSLHVFLGLVFQHLRAQPAAVASAFETWIRRKGLVLESQKRLHEGLTDTENPEALRVGHELERVRARLSALAFSPAEKEGPEAVRRRMEALELEQEKLIGNLTRLSRAFALQRKVGDADAGTVARALPDRTALVEVARVNLFNFAAKGRKDRWLPSRYLAFVLHAGRPDDIRLVDLGDAGAVDAAVARLKADIVAGRPWDRGGAADTARRLHDLVFAPLTPDLGEAREIFISPDGNLNLVPFEVLKAPDGRFLIEVYGFNYLAAGRDVLSFSDMARGAGPALLMGDPDFDLDADRKAAALSTLALAVPGREAAARRSADTWGLRFSRLPGTRDEVLSIRELLGPDRSECFLGADALEEILQNRRAPRLLHLATHGFFLEDTVRPEVSEPDDAIEERGLTAAEAPAPVPAMPAGQATGGGNPLLRSGIVLAGANRSLSADPQAAGGDGIVTAEKILGLGLWGTEMVVLSACETGLGDVRTGEGVYGLRRAFTQAGARSIVMSMWSVPDRETQELMTEFYRGIRSGRLNRCQALRQAVLKEMATVKQRYGDSNPFLWGAFVFLGAP